jgi:hypothetical protein
MSEATLVRATRALHQAFVANNPMNAVTTAYDTYDGYAPSVEANLLRGVMFSELRKDFDMGKGQELIGQNGQPPKMAATHSSSALVVNAFGPWRRDPATLTVNRFQGFVKMRFEAQCRNGLRGTPPHLDVRLDTKDMILGIESKCVEYLTPTKAEFRPAYDSIMDGRKESCWFRYIAALRQGPHQYQYLDVAQLIKHYLGLCYKTQATSLCLLYIFGEPLNWEAFSEFKQHREEISRFRQVVSGDKMGFDAFSYAELWREWEMQSTPSWLPSHLQALKARYGIEI